MASIGTVLLSFLLATIWVCPLEKKIPDLPLGGGEIRLVKSPAELKLVLENSPQNITVMLADGIYRLLAPISMRKGKNVVILGASRDPAKAIIEGNGFSSSNPDGDDLIRIGNVENVTVAFLTFANCRSYGVKIEAENFPRNIHIYGCNFKDIGVRMIKGSTSLEGRAVGGSIRHCRFENTQVPPADWLFEGDYITAIDMMALDGWQISDNLFLNIKGRNGGARGAVFIWVRSKNVTVERNAILHCDRGISFGNPSGSTNYVPGQEHVRDSMIRNNIIVPGTDAGIELWWAENIQVYNNTIWREDIDGRGLRGGMDKWNIRGIDVANNIVRGKSELEGEVTLRNNLIGDFAGISVGLFGGEWQLKGLVPAATGKGLVLKEVTDDYTGRARSKSTDIGACETGGLSSSQ